VKAGDALPCPFASHSELRLIAVPRRGRHWHSAQVPTLAPVGSPVGSCASRCAVETSPFRWGHWGHWGHRANIELFGVYQLGTCWGQMGTNPRNLHNPTGRSVPSCPRQFSADCTRVDESTLIRRRPTCS
jgi:hypothetical protein